MTFNDLQKRIGFLKEKHPVWFALLNEQCPTIDEVKAFESEFSVKLPDEFVEFMQIYGGGYFAFSIIYSLEEKCDFNLTEINTVNRDSSYIIFSENSVGDFYGFQVIDNICSSDVYFYDHETNHWEKTHFSFVTFIYEVALSQK